MKVVEVEGIQKSYERTRTRKRKYKGRQKGEGLRGAEEVGGRFEAIFFLTSPHSPSLTSSSQTWHVDWELRGPFSFLFSFFFLGFGTITEYGG